jgi:hypothetical protein
VFCYTLWRFYAFPRTNPLMRCHSASFLFLLFLCFKKATQEIFSELDETKAKIPIFPKHHGVQSWDGGAPGAGRTIGWCGLALATPLGGVAAWPTFWRRPSAYIFPSTRKPKGTHQFSSKHNASHRHRRCEIGRVQKLFSASCRRGESLSEAFFITMPTSGVIRE